MKLKRIITLLVSFSICFFATAEAKSSLSPQDTPSYQPWFTGPLLAPSGHTVAPGHRNYELYWFYTDNVGFYNNRWVAVHQTNTHTLSPTLSVSQGLTNFMDIALTVPYDFNYRSGQNDSNFGDVSLAVGFQIINANPNTWLPNFRITLAQAFPTGKYQNLNPTLLGTDATGSGSYQTGIGFNFQKLLHIYAIHFLNLRLSFVYTVPFSTSVRNFNSYGGGSGTNGTVDIGNKFSTDLAFEYNLTQHWVAAMDALYLNANKSTFRGTPGVTTSGGIASVSAPSSEGFSLAPAIEYNFNANVGIIAGVWFSVTGRNSGDFTSGVVAINFYQ